MPTLPDITRRHLGWSRVASAFQDHLRAPVSRSVVDGREMHETLPGLPAARACFRLQDDVEAAMEAGGSALVRDVLGALGQVEDLRDSLAHARQGGILEVLELAGVLRLLEATAASRELLAHGPAPLIAQVEGWAPPWAASAWGAVADAETEAAPREDVDVAVDVDGVDLHGGGRGQVGDEAEVRAAKLGDATVAAAAEDEAPEDRAAHLRSRLDAAIAWTEEGPTLRDDASEGLKRARERLHGAQRALAVAAGRLVRRLRDTQGLQDEFWTEREGRVVLPVRADGLHLLRDDGAIVHGSSGTGQTLFVEPSALVGLNNAVKSAQRGVRAEVRRVLETLTGEIVTGAREIWAQQRMVWSVDDLLARVGLSRALDAVTPGWCASASSSSATFELTEARHPGMVLDGAAVVPFDLRLPLGHALVVSGPNAGGKTVALKTLGLCMLLAQAGLRIPCRQATLPWVGPVVTSVGDDQSIAASLSTFTAQLARIAAALEVARTSERPPLVLLDEVAAGTEPAQGAALAEAVVRELVERGATVLATTHYERLKTLGTASDDPLRRRVTQASVGFDLDRMQPTYELILGVPGASSALEVARRVGLDGGVVERAEGFLDPGRVRFEELVKQLGAERSRLAQASEALREESARQAQRGRLLDDREAKIEARVASEQVRAHQRATRELSAYEGEVKRRRKALRRAQAAEDREAQRALVARGDALLETHRPAPKSAPSGARPPVLEVGARVRVTSLGSEGTVLALRGDRVEVQLPNFKTTVKRDALEMASEEPATRVRRGVAAPVFSTPRRGVEDVADRHFDEPAQPFVPGPDDVVDLRGMRGEEAWSATKAHLSEAVARGRDVSVILHGEGDGILRRLVRQRLPELIEVKRFRSGLSEEGGTGVTVVRIDV